MSAKKQSLTKTDLKKIYSLLKTSVYHTGKIELFQTEFVEYEMFLYWLDDFTLNGGNCQLIKASKGLTDLEIEYAVLNNWKFDEDDTYQRWVSEMTEKMKGFLKNVHVPLTYLEDAFKDSESFEEFCEEVQVLCEEKTPPTTIVPLLNGEDALVTKGNNQVKIGQYMLPIRDVKIIVEAWNKLNNQ